VFAAASAAFSAAAGTATGAALADGAF